MLKAAGFITPEGEVDVAKAARELNVSERSVNRWLVGQSIPRPAVQHEIRKRVRGVETNAVSVPIVGKIDAGPLRLRWEAPLGFIEVVRRQKDEDLMALIVQGDSMEPEINSGDIILVRRQEHADHRDIVVATIDDEATVKWIEFRAGLPRLVDKDGNEVPRRGRKFVVLGKVLEVRRMIEPHA